MARRYLIDTDVLVEYLRGSDRAAEFLEQLEGELLISAITLAELFSGARGSDELDALDQFMLAFEVVPVDEPLARAGGRLRQEYHASHGVGLADALIAASATSRGAELVTFNRRHYPMVHDLMVPYER
ncbi:MAG: type II toxin-antitoxin system VapC family toxin [Anaerolineae bacterium]|nr:MAG: type II toxin-antitoxin system VapC family toxin [Anaerolineae bacterium]